MALAYVKEFNAVGAGIGGGLGQALQEPGVNNTGSPITFSTTTQSDAFKDSTRLIAITVDAAAHMEFGENPTATTNSYPIQANQEYVRAIVPGQKVAFIAA